MTIKPNKKQPFFILLFLLLFINIAKAQGKYFTKSGHVSFFSYTLVEDIKADNNQVLSIIDTSNSKIVIKILMRSFHFKKALMQEHFNENYIESHKFPKAIFKGEILNFTELQDNDVTEVKGTLIIRGIKKNITLKVKIKKEVSTILLTGNFNVQVADFDIKIPSVVSKNISKTIKISFELNHKPYKP